MNLNEREQYLKTANYFLYESADEADQEVVEEGLKDFILPIIAIAGLFTGAHGKDLDLGKMIKDNQFVQKVEDMKEKTFDQVDREIEDFIKKGNSVKNDVTEIIKDMGNNMYDVLNQIKDQKFELIVDPNLDAPFKIDTKNKKFYIKDWESVKNSEGLKKAIEKGILFGDKVKELMGNMPKINIKPDVTPEMPKPSVPPAGVTAI